MALESTKIENDHEKYRILEKCTVFWIDSSEKCILIKNEITYLDPELTRMNKSLKSRIFKK